MMTKNVLIKPIDKCFTLKTRICCTICICVHLSSEGVGGVVQSPDFKSATDPHSFPITDIHNYQKVVGLL